MHELGLCQSVLEAVVDRAQGRQVDWARVRVGGHPVDPDVIGQGVALLAVGTEAEHMSLELRLEPLRTRCARCGAEEPVTDAAGLAACRRCGGIDVEVVGSEHAVVEAVAYGDPHGPQGTGSDRSRRSHGRR